MACAGFIVKIYDGRGTAGRCSVNVRCKGAGNPNGIRGEHYRDELRRSGADTLPVEVDRA